MRICTNCGREYPQANAEPGCNMCLYCRSARDLGKALADGEALEALKKIFDYVDNISEYDEFIFETAKAVLPDSIREAKPKRPPIPAEVAAQLDRDEEIYGDAFIHLSGGKWRRLDPTKMVLDVGEDPTPVPRHQFTPVEGDSVLCIECGLPATDDVHF